MAKKTNCVKNGFDYYRITATVGFTSDGKRVRKEFLGKSKKEATEMHDEYLEGINKGLNVGYEKVSFGEFFEEWLMYVHKPTVSQSTFNRYEGLHRLWIKPSSFYCIKLINLRSMEIQKHLNNMPSAYTSQKVYLLMSTFFKYCIKDRLILFNPLDNVSLRKSTPKRSDDDKCLTRNGVALLMNDYVNDIKLFIYAFALMTGMREGELCALTHKDIDFNNMTININKSLNRVSAPDKNGVMRTEVRINPPKTKSSIRIIPLPKSMVAPLKMHILNEKKKHMSIGIPFATDTFLFTSTRCTPLRGDHLNERWKKYQKKLEITPIISFHGLRHTFCTLLAREGTPLKTAAILMGHSKIETTAKIYTHVDQKAKEDAIDLLEKIVL